MTPFNPRIVFAAVVAFTDRVTRDGRILATPEGLLCPTRTLPLPVLWTPPNQGGKPRQTITVGRIEQAYVVDHRLITFGHLIETEEIKQAVVPLLQNGSRFLEIDVNSAAVDYNLSPEELLFDSDPEPVGPMIFRKWKLSAAWIGESPCWDLPKVQIEEITR